MEETQLKAFAAITHFVGDLFDVFGNSEKKENEKATPLALYHRFVFEHVKFTDKQAIGKTVSGFLEFCTLYDQCIRDDKLEQIPENARISYSKRLYIDIHRYLSISDIDTRRAIRSHLLTICAILIPSPDTMKQLENLQKHLELNENSAEGKFISNIFDKIPEIMGKVDSTNPMASITGLFQSGIIGEMVSGFQQGAGSGELDPAKLLGSMQSVIGSLMQQQPQSGGFIQNSALP